MAHFVKNIKELPAFLTFLCPKLTSRSNMPFRSAVDVDADAIASAYLLTLEQCDWAIYWTFGNFSKPLAANNLPKYPAFLGNFCKGVKIFNFSSEIIFWQLL